jgi:hypothetical protein
VSTCAAARRGGREGTCGVLRGGAVALLVEEAGGLVGIQAAGGYSVIIVTRGIVGYYITARARI